MNRLAGTRAYLRGAMDRVPDAGTGWRRRLRRDLHNLDIHFDTWTEMVGYIRHIAHDDVVATYDRWLFFDWTGSVT